MIKRIALSAVPLAAAAALTMAGVAQAAPVPTVNSDGTVGYQAVQNPGGTTYFTHVIGQFGLGNPQYGNTNPTLETNPALLAELHGASILPTGTWAPFNAHGVVANAARVGLCGGEHHFNPGTTVQDVIVPTSTHTYEVVAFKGTFSSTGDACLDTVLPTGYASILLRNVPSRDTMQLEVLYDGLHSHNGVGPGNATIVAHDLSNPSSSTVNTNGVSGPVFPTPHSEFYEADAGAIGAAGRPQDSLPSDVGPDANGPNLLVKLAHVQLNGNNENTGQEVHGTLQSDAAWEAVPVTVHSHGDIAAAVSVFKSDHFSVYTAPGTLDYPNGNGGNGAGGHPFP
jgi:hypothetical protein